ncbi:hypothetical protein CY34DRAFT_30925, partial [Suillus luteus UH-Slu-Lm8-n1]
LRVLSGRDMNRPAFQTVLRGHADSVLSVSFSPDGLVSSLVLWIRLFGCGTGEPVGEPLRGHPSSVNSVLISLDGTRIVTVSQDYTDRV